jgi:hypothetical protein
MRILSCPPTSAPLWQQWLSRQVQVRGCGAHNARLSALAPFSHLWCVYVGLALCLSVGLDVARRLAIANNLPFVAVNHLEVRLCGPLHVQVGWFHE